MKQKILLTLVALVILSGTLSTATAMDVPPDRTDRLASRFAMTFGTPSGINIGFSHWTKAGYGLRLTVGTLPVIPFGYLDGGQAELLLRTFESGRTILDFSFGIGGVEAHSLNMIDGFWSSDDHYEAWSYVGGFITLNTRGFFVQSGITFGMTGTRTPIMGFQVGFSLHSWHSYR